jgi:hypothetical protein
MRDERPICSAFRAAFGYRRPTAPGCTVTERANSGCCLGHKVFDFIEQFLNFWLDFVLRE